MKYSQKIVLKNGKEAYLRNGAAADGNNVFEVFNLTHAETDYLLSYPDENSFDPEAEGQFLEQKAESENEIYEKQGLKAYHQCKRRGRNYLFAFRFSN